MGTRFYASHEAAGHAEAKRRILGAEGGQTVRSIVFDLSRAPMIIETCHKRNWVWHKLKDRSNNQIENYEGPLKIASTNVRIPT